MLKKTIKFSDYFLYLSIIFSIGYIHLVKIFVGIFFFLNPNIIKSYYSWSKAFLLGNKSVEIYSYIFSVPLILIYFAFVYFMYRKFESNNKSAQVYNLILAIIFNISLATIARCNLVILLLLFIIWGGIYFVLCRYLIGDTVVTWIKNKGLRLKYVVYIIFFLSLIHFFNLFSPYVFQEMKMINNFLEVPSFTKVDGTYVNDNDYMEEINERYSDKNKLSSLDKSFLKKSRFEFHWRTLDRWVIHHHNHVLGPISELSLGKPVSLSLMQYGWLNVVVFKKILEFTGGINWHNYFKVFYSVYYIYYLFFALITLIIFKNKKMFFATWFLTLYSFNRLNIFILLGPGLNPVRHFFDIFVFLFVYLYLKNKQKRYLIISYLLCLLAIANNIEFGAMLSLSCMGLIFVKNLLSKASKYEGFLTIIFGFFALLVVFLVPKGLSGGGNYFMQGFLGLSYLREKLTFIFLLIVLGYAILIKNIDKKNIYFYMTIFLFFYAQLLLVYYIWGTDTNHLMNFFPIFVLTFMFFIKVLFKHEGRIILSILLLSLLLFLTSVTGYYKNFKEYNDTFNNKKLFVWNNDKIKMVSTMDPIYFEDSVYLLNKYVEGNGVYMLSKFDNFLPLLAEKYSLMPYIDVSWGIVTTADFQKMINFLNEHEPEYLFVDRNIANPKRVFNDNLLRGEGLLDEFNLRAERLNLLNKIFEEIKQDYNYIDSSYLLTAYKRKNV